MTDRTRQKSAAADSFGRNAEGYRTSPGHRAGEGLDRLASWCADAGVALDVATGAGHTAGAVSSAGVPTVVALDAAPAMVAIAVESGPGIRGVVGDAERLPFAPDTVDAVTCRIAPHHFPDPEAFVREVGRVLRPGGTFALEDNVAPADDELDAFLNRLERMRDPTHVRSYRTSTWQRWLTDAGFTVEETDHLMRTVEFDGWVDRMSALDADDRERVHRHLLEAPERAAEYFAIRTEEGRVRSFANLKALIRATAPPE